jgi:rhodanese-related sulfurtransferase
MDSRTVQERRDDIQIVDVREEDEWGPREHIDGARHIQLAQLPTRLAETRDTVLANTGHGT